MIGMEGNPWATKLTAYRLEGSPDALARLALAYELRTTNMIAWATAAGTEPTPVMAMDISRRMGMVTES